MPKFFENKHRIELRKKIISIQQTLDFLNEHEHIPHDIEALQKYGSDWFSKCGQLPYIYTWDILTFYRCITRLSEANVYFSTPPPSTTSSFLLEFNQAKVNYTAKITRILDIYQDHYKFSKTVWAKYSVL